MRARELEMRIEGLPVRHGSAHLSVGASVGVALLGGDIDVAALIEAADQAMYARKDEERPRSVLSGSTTEEKAYAMMSGVSWSSMRADLVAQHQLAFLQPLHLDQIGGGRRPQGRDRGIEVAMLLLQARQLLPQRTFFLSGHRHRW